MLWKIRIHSLRLIIGVDRLQSSTAIARSGQLILQGGMDRSSLCRIHLLSVEIRDNDTVEKQDP